MSDNPADEGIDVSILIVNWNTRGMTLACLRSLYEQTRGIAFEVILVDNGSEDGSADAIRAEFPQVRLIAEQANHGFARANNIAAEVARGRYVLLLNSDTVVLDGAIQALVRFADSTPDAQLWGGRTLFGDRSLNPTSCWGRITGWSAFCFATGLAGLARNTVWLNPEGIGGWRRDSVRGVDVVSGCFFLIGRAFWNQLGGFDPAFFMYGEEADLCARARDKGARPLITPEATIIHYGGASTAKFAKRIVYVFAARLGLIRRQLRGPERLFAAGVTIFGVFWRAMLYRLADRVTAGDRYRAQAREWGEAWGRRHEWRKGPLQGAA